MQLSDEMRQQGLQPAVITCDAVISACGKCKMSEGALQLLHEIQQQGLVPNVIPYSAVIKAGELTLRLFVRGSSRAPCQLFHQQCRVSACRKCELPGRAVRLLKVRQQGLEPSVITYTTGSSACELTA